MLNDLPKLFANPGCEFRGKPFWAWNSKLEPAELQRQIRLMKRMGLGGFFMHSRVGLNTEYLGKDWFDCIRACIDEAQKQDMQAWAYDEDRWPSGAGGGIITQNPAYRMRKLRMEAFDNVKDFARNGETLAVFVGKIDGITLRDARLLAPGENPKLAAGESVIHIFVKVTEPSDWYNGGTYVDAMNKKAIAEFIKTTHEAYKREVGKHFGKEMPGIFTDEPNHGNTCSNGNHDGEMPWTPSLPQEFKKRYGFDLIPHLAELFYDVEGAGLRARYCFHDCTTALFVEAFSQQIGEWCDKNHMLSTGHMLHEDSLSMQADNVGDCMRHYEYMQTPGIDVLMERNVIFSTAKQTVSMARQFGKKWRISETYGCTGWDFPFAGHKALSDWQAALGINIRCQHLAWYSARGEAKRDYPASISYQSPWWEEYSKVEDYFARVFSVITRGEEIRDILMIHPVESAWLNMTADNWRGRPAMRELDHRFQALTHQLLADNLDFDYGCEEVMARHTKVGHDDVGAFIKVGKALYRAVVIPTMATMRGTTLALLQKFHAAGGTVIFTDEPAALVDAEPNTAVAEFSRLCVSVTLPQLSDALADYRRLSITDADGGEILPTLYNLREDDEAYYLFVCNTGIDYTQLKEDRKTVRAIERKLAFPEVTIKTGKAGTAIAAAEGTPLEFKPDTGEIVTAAHARKNGELAISTTLPAIGSRLFVIPKTKNALTAPAAPRYEPHKIQDLGNEFDLALSEANTIVFDWPEYSIDGGEKHCDEILAVDAAVRASLGLLPRGGSMKQPWVRGTVKDPRSAVVALDYRFDVAALPSGTLALCMENPACAQVFLNDREIATDMENGWWCDISLRQLPVPPDALRLGENHLRIVYDYDENNSGLEIVYLRGDFAVRDYDKIPVMDALPAEIRLGDWTAQGLPFYSGAVIYRQNVNLFLDKKEKAFLLLGEWRGAAVKVRVNGETAGIIAWAPHTVEITDFLKNNAENAIELEVISHHRNSHGPFHNDIPNPDWTGPEVYLQHARRNYALVPCGLLGEPQIVVMR